MARPLGFRLADHAGGTFDLAATLRDRTAVIAAWGVYDPVGGTHGPIARPAIFVVGRDLRISYEYVGRDFADRPPNPAVWAALDVVRGAQARPLEHTVSGP